MKSSKYGWSVLRTTPRTNFVLNVDKTCPRSPHIYVVETDQQLVVLHSGYVTLLAVGPVPGTNRRRGNKNLTSLYLRLAPGGGEGSGIYPLTFSSSARSERESFFIPFVLCFRAHRAHKTIVQIIPLIVPSQVPLKIRPLAAVLCAAYHSRLRRAYDNHKSCKVCPNLFESIEQVAHSSTDEIHRLHSNLVGS